MIDQVPNFNHYIITHTRSALCVSTLSLSQSFSQSCVLLNYYDNPLVSTGTLVRMLLVTCY